MRIRKLIVLLLLTLASADMAAQDYTLHLDSVTISGHKHNSGVKMSDAGITTWDMKLLDQMPKILGNADPLHYAQMLPSIQTSNEYDSGIYIEGCEAQHNNITIGGVTMYNVSHLMGFFSLFNASHYPTMQLRKTAMDSSDANRLGGSIDMQLPDSLQQTVNGEFSVGLISSQGTLRVPLTSKSSLFISLRSSYLNLLYSHWLSVDGSSFRYSFTDANATYLYKPSQRNTFWIDTYYGYDNAKADLHEFGGQIRLKWGNHKLSGHLLHAYANGNELEHTLYSTGTRNNFAINLSVTSLALPSDITDVGYKLQFRGKRLRVGLETIYHHIQPQSPESDNTFTNIDNRQSAYDTHENSIYADYTQPIVAGLKLCAGLRGITYVEDMRRYLRKTYFALDPNLSLSYKGYGLHCSLNYNMRHQMLFQTGLSTVNMPTEFWMGATVGVPPQYGHCFSLQTDYTLPDGSWNFSAEVYYKKLFNQIEYCGTPLELITRPYNLNSNLYHGRGHNYGFSLMLNKRFGQVNGWMSYTFSRSKRQFAEYGYQGWYSSLHERPHEFNVVLTYDVSRRISLGASGVAASGTPFTASRSLYTYNGNIVVEKGEHNANRLHPYLRLDLSLNYKLHTKCFKESGLNFSIYNAQYRSNDVSYYVSTNKDHFVYKSVKFILPILPSISYYAKF